MQRTLLALVLLLASPAVELLAADAAKAPRPNIVFIMADDK